MAVQLQCILYVHVCVCNIVPPKITERDNIHICTCMSCDMSYLEVPAQVLWRMFGHNNDILDHCLQ